MARGGGATLGERLLVLAGPKASGKTMLLTQALTHRMPLFGAEDDVHFQATKLPGVVAEFRLSPREVIERGTWASDSQHAAIAAMDTPPETLVAHLDTMTLCRVRERSFESLCNADENLTEMCAHPQAAIFARYRAVHMAQLQTPYALCAAWFNERSARWKKPPAPCEIPLYAGDATGEAAFAAVDVAWRRFVARLPNVVARRIVFYNGDTVSVTEGAPKSA